MKIISLILRMKSKGLSDSQVSSALKVSKGTVNSLYNKFNASKLPWPLPSDMTDTALRDILYPKRPSSKSGKIPDWEKISLELAKPMVTLQLLFEEHQKGMAIGEKGLCRSAFYASYRSYRKSFDIAMPMLRKGGQKLFVDYSGDGIGYTDPVTQQFVELEVFVAAFGASGYAFVDVTSSQNKFEWVQSHIRAFEFYDALPWQLIPDNLKSAVLTPDYYEPDLNPHYAMMAEHYDVAILPARVRKPKDKALVESCVLQVQRRVLAPLRNEKFNSIEEVRTAVMEKLAEFNDRPMKDYGGATRKERYLLLDKPHTKPLPLERFGITDLKHNALVPKNYHVTFNDHYYSVPFNLIAKHVDIYQSGKILEIYYDSSHVCRHEISLEKYTYTTNQSHMPSDHLWVRKQTPAKLIFEGGKYGENTASFIKNILERTGDKEQSLRQAQGVLKLAKTVKQERIENATKRANFYKTFQLNALKSILINNLDSEPIENEMEETPSEQLHVNVRGPQAYKIITINGGL